MGHSPESSMAGKPQGQPYLRTNNLKSLINLDENYGLCYRELLEEFVLYSGWIAKGRMVAPKW